MSNCHLNEKYRSLRFDGRLTESQGGWGKLGGGMWEDKISSELEISTSKDISNNWDFFFLVIYVDFFSFVNIFGVSFVL